MEKKKVIIEQKSGLKNHEVVAAELKFLPIIKSLIIYKNHIG